MQTAQHRSRLDRSLQAAGLLDRRPAQRGNRAFCCAGMLSWLSTAFGAGLWGVLICVVCFTWKPLEEQSSPTSQRSIHTIDAFFEEHMQMEREAAIQEQAEADDAGGVPMTSANHEYHVQGKLTGGIILAGTIAAETMKEAATDEVRRLQKEEGGYVKKGGPAAQLAAREARAKRPRRGPRNSGFEL